MVALGFALLQQLWKNRRDAYNARVDEFCKLIFEAADQAAEYWITKKPSKVAKPAPELKAKLALAESKLEGYQLKVNFFQVLIRERSWTSKHDQIVANVADFLDAMTGGEFGAEVRQPDPTRVRLVYTTAAELVATLRSTMPRFSKFEMLTGALLALAFAYLVLHSLGLDVSRFFAPAPRGLPSS
ncbi:hypothetical protein SAMN05216573_12151 [Bradyrhizobium sp. Rc3b]|uniref:hypothetical protein n=1 Tax=Bradyrhizobium sp. Rc3b TaxID=1855322 RepID=UPI0008F280EF|nr:hypothetical protein [Bradyrhizobium sp. Rc3b]SFN77795.1 hypothetical protein SAMN05216573_12151 [Bradyrhizobium sp. Rc3b]